MTNTDMSSVVDVTYPKQNLSESKTEAGLT